MKKILFVQIIYIFTFVCAEGVHAQSLINEALLWNQQESYQDTEIQILPFSADFKDKVPLTLVVLKRSHWELEEVFDELSEAQKVFSRCKVSFYPVKLVLTDMTSEEPYDFDGTDDIFFPKEILPKRPVAIFDQVRLVDGKENVAGYANPLFKSVEPSLNSVFLFHQGYLVKKERPKNQQDYGLLAHELAHVLFNEGHNKIYSNLLYYHIQHRRNAITHPQCAYLRQNFL